MSSNEKSSSDSREHSESLEDGSAKQTSCQSLNKGNFELEEIWKKQQRTFSHRSPRDILQLHTDTAPMVNNADASKHAFWSGQPVPQHLQKLLSEAKSAGSQAGALEKQSMKQGPMEVVPQKISETPFPLKNSNLIWTDLALESASTDSQAAPLNRVYNLLKEHYVENFDSTFRFHYSKEFLTWALLPPNYEKTWYVGIEEKDTKCLIAFISAIPRSMRLGSIEFTNQTNSVAEINFLCIHKAYRKQRLAEVLIQEITRRVHLRGVFQALYTSGSILPSPFARAQYFHRALNVDKLIKVGFTEIPPSYKKFRDPKRMIERYYALPPKDNNLPSYREMEKRDIPIVRKLLNENYKRQCAVAPKWDSDDLVEHWLLPRDNVVYSYVVERRSKNSTGVTDFFSFYLLPSSVLDSTDEGVNAAYCYYSAASQSSIAEILRCAIICANNKGFDVFNALNILEMDKQTLIDLKFNEGDGFLNYYLFNYQFPVIPSTLVGVIML